MSNPTVCCICLTKDRPEMLLRAVASFRAQTYENKQILVCNSGLGPLLPDAEDVLEPCFIGADAWTIGHLRNAACEDAIALGADIIAHFDDDDYSHPNRLSEQVALLQSSGAEAVGYNSMLFWDTRYQLRNRMVEGVDMWIHQPVNAAWLYRAINPKHILGTSLMYWRSTWERLPFDDIPTGEDTRFAAKLKVCGVDSIGPCDCHTPPKDHEPRMVASIHGGNSSGYAPEKDRAGSRRVPEWDDWCRKVMQL